MNIKKYTNKMYCFSPPVMLATFVIEVGLAIFTLVKYRLDMTTRLIIALLVLLATFQFAEYNVCEGLGMDPQTWSRIGYVAITLLPPLGIHLAYQLSGTKARRRILLWPAYLSGVAFAVFFLFIGHSLTSQSCMGNYVIFMMAPGSEILYGMYYYGWLLGAIALSHHLSQKAKPQIKRALLWLQFGYIAFILPTTAANIIDPQTINGIPSIMCGFAILMALALAFGIAPHVARKRRK